MKRIAAVIGLLSGICASAAAIAQQGVEDFYKGRTVSIVMGTGPGGSYDLYGRLVANHFGRHIPGNPTMIVEHMPGAGGATAANFMFGPGPQDGSRNSPHARAAAHREAAERGRAFRIAQVPMAGRL